MEKIIIIDRERVLERVRRESAYWGSRHKEEGCREGGFTRIAVLPEDEEFFAPVISQCEEKLNETAGYYHWSDTTGYDERIESYVVYRCLAHWFAIVLPEMSGTMLSLAEEALAEIRRKISPTLTRPMQPF